MSRHLLDKVDIVSMIVPINLGSARASDVISMKNWGRCSLVFFKAAGSASEDPVLTVEQVKNVAGSSNKALNFTSIWVKQGTLTSVGTWTETTQAAANTYSNSTASENQGIYVIEIKAEDLDVDNDYDCIQCSIADAGSVNQIGCVLAILHEPRYAKSGGISAIAN